MRIGLTILVAGLAVLLPAVAQFEQGSIVGTVSDPQKAPDRREPPFRFEASPPTSAAK